MGNYLHELRIWPIDTVNGLQNGECASFMESSDHVAGAIIDLIAYFPEERNSCYLAECSCSIYCPLRDFFYEVSR